jgi:hypothetical protein
MQSLAIVSLCIFSAVFYGILHDQVSARVCIEYFTIGHPPIFGTDNPTLLGLGWGVIATWWVGLLLGVPLAVAARAGSRPKRNARSLVRPLAWLLLIAALSAFVAGIIGWLLADRGLVFLIGPLAGNVPQHRHVAFLAALWAHSASYLVGAIGGIVLILLVWRWRGRTELERRLV